MHSRDADRPAPSPASPEEQRKDSEEGFPMIGTGVVTSPMLKGAVLWTAVGFVAGAAIGALVALIPMGDIALTTKLWVFAVCGALAGATAGVLYGGGRQPELEREVGNEARGPSLTEEQRDPVDTRPYVEQMKHRRPAQQQRPRRAG